MHGPDVVVVDFNGKLTRGIEQHLQWATAAVSAAPESRVLSHPIKIAAGNWTAVTGSLPGNLTMVTIAHWQRWQNRRGVSVYAESRRNGSGRMRSTTAKRYWDTRMVIWLFFLISTNSFLH